MSRSAIDKLGKRLAEAALPTEDHWAAYIALQAEWRDALDAVRATVEPIARQEGVAAKHVTHRLKTYETLVEKLRGEHTRLSSIQDVGGVRIVCPVVLARGVTTQDRVVSHLTAAFPGARIKDRRATPSHGYRAVHVVVQARAHPIEVQVRTGWQHVWADATERIADVWGRQIRYGGSPDAASNEEREERERQLVHWLRAADAIGRIESAVIRWADDGLRDPILDAVAELDGELAACPALAPLLHAALDELKSGR